MESFGAFGVPGSGIFMALIVGALAGWIAEKITKSDHGIFTNIVLGCLGSFVGWWVIGLLNLSIGGGFLPNLVVAALGAMLLIFVYRKIKGR